MAYDGALAARVRAVLGDRDDLVEKRMFGGVGYLVRGNMACGVHGDRVIARVGPEAYQEALDEPHTRPFDLTGRPMTGWVTVGPEGYATDAALAEWVMRGVAFALTLPAKTS
jgi:hypothetical protein